MANGKRGRRPKSIDTLKLTGQYREDRHGNQETPTPKGNPMRPRKFKGDAKKLWDAVVPQLIELRMATSLDQHSLESMCEWWQTYRDLVNEPLADGILDRQRQLLSRKTAYDCFLKLAQKFGMNAVDRQGIRLPKEKEQANPFEAFLDSQTA